MYRYVGRLFLKSSNKPIEILGKLNQMAGFDPDEEIELYEVSISFLLHLFNVSINFNVITLVILSVCNSQEIKFEPCVMCEHLDKRTSFRLSQVHVLFSVGFAYRWDLIFYVGCVACRLKMEISYAFRNLLRLKVKKNVDIQTCLHFWNMCITGRCKTCGKFQLIAIIKFAVFLVNLCIQREGCVFRRN